MPREPKFTGIEKAKLLTIYNIVITWPGWRPFFSLQSFLALPLAGCLEAEVSENKKIEAEELIEVDNPCSMPQNRLLSR